jgi:hypothetical protein
MLLLQEIEIAAKAGLEAARVLPVEPAPARCPTHGDPLICLACEADEDQRPEWAPDLERYRTLAQTHRVPRDPMVDERNAALFALIARLDARRIAIPHRCSGCGHRWAARLTVAELCGDCWRNAQTVLHSTVDTQAPEIKQRDIAMTKKDPRRPCTMCRDGYSHDVCDADVPDDVWEAHEPSPFVTEPPAPAQEPSLVERLLQTSAMEECSDADGDYEMVELTQSEMTEIVELLREAATVIERYEVARVLPVEPAQDRLRELAKAEMRRRHEHALYAASNGHPDEGHVHHGGYDWRGFDVCPHPDCRLVQEAVLPVEEPQERVIRPLVIALTAIMELGRKDTSNPKYDGYYKSAREAIDVALRVLVEGPQESKK